MKNNLLAIIEKLKQNLAIVDLIQKFEMGIEGRINGKSFQGNCPSGHSSVGGTCFGATGPVYHCFNCGISGDVINFYQDYIDQCSFIEAIAALASLAGVNIDSDLIGSKHFVSSDEKKAVRAAMNASTRIFHEHLMKSPPHINFLYANYGFTRETISKFKIGLSAQPDKLLSQLISEGHSKDICVLTGLFTPLRNDYYAPFYVNRFVFPYLIGSNTVYSIGRKTEQTPNNEWERAKYKKLQSSENKDYVSKLIMNDVFYNEECIRNAKNLIITEGVCDCIALNQIGFNSISPVTTKFRDKDTEKLLSLLRKDQKIIIVNDNEFNNAGEKGAFEMSLQLSLHGYQVYNITLPLLEEHNAARRRIKEITERIGA